MKKTCSENSISRFTEMLTGFHPLFDLNTKTSCCLSVQLMIFMMVNVQLFFSAGNFGEILHVQLVIDHVVS